MIQEVTQAVMTSISDVLGTMFFMIIEFDEETTQDVFKPPKNGEMIGCTLDFKGIFSGTFIVLIPEKQLQAMAIDFMGMNAENIDETHTTGTIKEVTNMIAGNSFGCYDDKLEFSLGIPELIDRNDLQEKFDETGMEEIFLAVKTEESVIVVKVIIR